MNQLTLIAGKFEKVFKVPENWNELSLSQYKEILSLKNPTYYQVFKVLIRENKKDFLAHALLKNMQKHDIFKINAFVEAFLSVPPLHTKQFLQSIKIGRKKIQTAENFSELEFWKFAQADTVLLASPEVSPENISQMIAYLYDCDLKQAQKVSAIEREIFLRWFLGNRLGLVEKYAALFESGTSTSAYNFGWFGTLDSISTNLAEMEINGKQTVETVFYYLQMKLLKQKEQEAKQKTAK